MIADGLSRSVESFALGFSSLGYSYRLRIDERHDGKHIVSVLVLDDAPRARWTGRYLAVCANYAQAQIVKGRIADRLRDRACLPCGSQLLNEEIKGTRGISCYSCDGIRQANGGRWPA
jgi:hypothetical protein